MNSQLCNVQDCPSLLALDKTIFRFNPSPADSGYVLPFANSVDPDQLASKEANWSGSALSAIKYLNL